jgi:hypothetical protein
MAQHEPEQETPAGAPPEAAEAEAEAVDPMPPAGWTWNPATDQHEPPAAPEAAEPGGTFGARMMVSYKNQGGAEAAEAAAPEEDDGTVIAYLKSAEYGKLLKNGSRAGVIAEATPGGSLGLLLAGMLAKGAAFDQWFWSSDFVNQRIKDAAYTVLRDAGIVGGGTTATGAQSVATAPPPAAANAGAPEAAEAAEEPELSALAAEDDDSTVAYLKSAEYGKLLKNGSRAGVIAEAAPGASVWQLLAGMLAKGAAFDQWFWASDVVNQRIKDAAYTVLVEAGIIKGGDGRQAATVVDAPPATVVPANPPPEEVSDPPPENRPARRQRRND